MMEQNADFSACLLIHYKSWFVSKPIAPLHSFHQSGIRFVLFHLITNRSLRQVSRLGGLSKIPYRSSTLKSIFRGTADDCQSSNSILIFLLSLFLDDTNSWPNNSAERWKFAFTHGSPTIDHPNSNRLQFSTAVASIPEPSDTNLSNSNGPNGCNDQMTWIRRPLMINRNFFMVFLVTIPASSLVTAFEPTIVTHTQSNGKSRAPAATESTSANIESSPAATHA